MSFSSFSFCHIFFFVLLLLYCLFHLFCLVNFSVSLRLLCHFRLVMSFTLALSGGGHKTHTVKQRCMPLSCQHALSCQYYMFSSNRNITWYESKCVAFSTGTRIETDCSEFRSTSCLPCADGTYMNKPSGLKSCFPCTNCVEGRFLFIFPITTNL